MRLPAAEFIRRFLMHAVPPGFPRILYYGFLASANRKMALPLCRKLLAVPVLDLLPRPALDYQDWYEEVTDESLRRNAASAHCIGSKPCSHAVRLRLPC